MPGIYHYFCRKIYSAAKNNSPSVSARVRVKKLGLPLFLSFPQCVKLDKLCFSFYQREPYKKYSLSCCI